MANLGDLMVRVGADIGGFKDAFKDAITLLESAGEKANRAGSAIAKAFDKLGVSDASAKVAAQAKSLQASFELLEKAYKDGRVSAEDFTKAQAGLRTELEKLSRIDFTSGIEKLQKRLSAIGDQAQNLGRTLSVGLTVPITAFAAVAVKSAADMESLEIGLKAVTKETGPLEAQLARLKEVAKLPGLGFKEAVQGSINLQAAGFSAQTAERALKAFGNALATVGKGREHLDGVITALSQIASKGKISAEEINQLAERLPQIRVAIKDAFGEGFTDAKAFEAAGITAEHFVERIIQQFEKLPKATGGFRNEMENLRDSADQALAAIGRALIPFATSILRALEPVIGFLKEMGQGFAELPGPMQTAVVAMAGLAAAAGPALYAFGGLTKGLAELSPLLSKLATAGAPAGIALGEVSLKAQLLAGSIVTLGAAMATVAIADAYAGFQELMEALDAVDESSKRAEGGLKVVEAQAQTTGSTFAKLADDVGGFFEHVSARKWELIGGPIFSLGNAFRDLGRSIQEASGKFPLLEAAARRAQSAVGDVARAQAEAAMRGTSGEAKDLAKKYEEERTANLRALEVAEKYLKMVKETKGSKEQLADATRRVTEAQRKLNPEFRAGGDAAGSYATKVKDANKQLADALTHFGVKNNAAAIAEERKRFADLEKAYKAGKVSATDFAKAQEGLNDKLAELQGWDPKLDRKYISILKEFSETANELQAKHNFKTLLTILGPDFFTDLKKAGAEADALRLKLDNISESARGTRGIAWVKEANKDFIELGEAVQRAGGYQLSLSEKVNQLASDYTLLAANVGQVGITQEMVLQKEADLIQARINLAKSQRQDTRELEDQLEKVNQKLANHGVEVKGIQKTWEEAAVQISTIVTNFTQDIAKTLFDGTKDWGAKFTALWRDLRQAVVATFLEPVTAEITKFMTTTLKDLIGGKGFGGLAKSINDVGAALRRTFGGGGTAASSSAAPSTLDLGGYWGGITGGAPQTPAAPSTSAFSSVSNLTGIVSAVSGVVDAVSSVVANFQFRAMNKSLDIIVKHTLQTANDLANLRSDSWLREDHLMVKLDDLWRTLLDTKDFLGTIMLGAVETISVKLEDLATVMSRGTSATEQVADGVVAPIPILEQIKDAITDGTSQIVVAIRAGGISGGTGTGMAGSGGRLAELQLKLTDMFERQNNILAELPPEIQAALKAGQLPPATEGEFRELITQFYSLHDTIVALQDEIARLTPQGGTGAAAPRTPRQTLSGALNPETMTLNPDELRTQVVAVGGGGGSVDMTGVIEVLGGLYQMLETKFDALLKVFGIDGLKGIEKKMQGTTGAVDQTTEATKQTTLAVDDTTSAVMESARVSAAATGDLGSVLGSAIRELPAAVGASVANATATSLIEGSMRESIGGQPFDYAALRMPAIPEFNPDSARPRTAFEVNNAYNRPVVNYNITGNTFRNRDDIDYFVDQLNSVGVR